VVGSGPEGPRLRTLAQALESLSRDAARRRTMGEAGRRRVAERFTQAAMAERHIDLYQRIRGTKG